MTIVGGIEQKVNSNTADLQYNGAVTALDDGGWVVAWQSRGQDGSDHGVYQQRYDADGTAMGVETLVNVNTYLDQAEPEVTALANGGWVVTWQSYYQYYNDWSTYQQVYDASGNVVWSEYGSGKAAGMSVAALEDGSWVSVTIASNAYLQWNLTDLVSKTTGYSELLQQYRVYGGFRYRRAGGRRLDCYLVELLFTE